MSETKHLLSFEYQNDDEDEDHDNREQAELQDFNHQADKSSYHLIRYRNVVSNPVSQTQPQMVSKIETPEPRSSSSSSSLAALQQAETSSTTRYGTLQSLTGSLSELKQNLLVDSRYSRTYFSRKQFFIAAISLSLFTAALAVTLIFGLPRLEAKREEYFAAKFFHSPLPEVVHSKFAVLVSGNEYPSCADAGRDMLLNRNGTVMDAALASLFCLTMASPHLVGLDSGFRGLVYFNQQTYAFNVQERTFYLGNRNNKSLSIAYPILPLAAEQLHYHFGQIPWSSILMPSIWLAENGTPVSQQLARKLRQHHLELQTQLKQIRELFIRTTNTTERFLKDGEMYKNPSLAEALKSIASNGSLALFNNAFIDEIASILNETVTIEKLKSFLPKTDVISISKPWTFSLFNQSLRIFSGSINDPDESIALAHMIKILEKSLNFNVDSEFNLCNNDYVNRSLKEGAIEFQYILDTLQFGAAALAKLRAKQTNESMILNEDHINAIVQLITNATKNKINQRDYSFFDISEELLINPSLVDHSTKGNNVQIIVHDGRSGDVVALTTSKRQTLFQGERKVISNRTGLILDVFEDEKTVPSVVQWPVLIKDNKHDNIYLTLGGVGGSGSFQTTSAMLQVLNKFLLVCQTLKSSIDESKLFYQPPNTFLYETSFPKAYIDILILMFERNNLKPTSIQKDWLDSAVYAMMMTKVDSIRGVNKTCTTANERKDNHDSIHNQLRSMVDFRWEGYVSGQ